MSAEENFAAVDAAIVGYCTAYDAYTAKLAELEEALQEGRMLLTRHRVKGGPLYFTPIWESGLRPSQAVDAKQGVFVTKTEGSENALSKLAPIPSPSLRNAQKHFAACLFWIRETFWH